MAANGQGWAACARLASRAQGIALVALLFAGGSYGQDVTLNPTRPTVANSATIQSPGVVQIEGGYDAYPQSVPGNQQTVAALLTYAPLARLRLDFGWSAFTHQQQGTNVTDGVGTLQIGGKVELRKENYHRAAPGVAMQYEAELPAASANELQGYGQQVILLLNHHYGPGGNFDLLVNGSLVQSDCETRSGCTYGGQQAVAISYHLQPQTRLYAEAFAQNVSQSNTPPGTYVFGGFYHQFHSPVGVDGGVRFGVSDHAASIGPTVGFVFGKRLHDQQ